MNGFVFLAFAGLFAAFAVSTEDIIKIRREIMEEDESK